MSKRLGKELMKLKKKKLDWIKVNVDEANIRQWDVIIEGPDKTPYENGSFKVKMEFPIDYPFKPPEVHFSTKIYSPHVKSDTGAICQGLLGDWAPTNNALSVLMKLRTIMEDPSSDAPVEQAIGQQYSEDKEAFVAEARKWTKKYAQ